MPVAIPAAVHQHPIFSRYPLLSSAGPGPLAHPISDDIKAEAKTLLVFILSDPTSTEVERCEMVKFSSELDSPDLALPAGAPAWAQRLFNGITGIRGAQDATNARLDRVEQQIDRVEQQLDRVEQQLDRMSHANVQSHAFQANLALSSFGHPLLAVQPLHDAVSGQLPPLPDNFDGSTLASLKRSSVDELNQALAAFGVTPEQRMNREDKARLLYRRLGGVPSVTGG